MERFTCFLKTILYVFEFLVQFKDIKVLIDKKFN